jgi:hypothetical protein
MLTQPAHIEEHVMQTRHSSYFNMTYTSMAFLITLAEKKNILLSYIKKCDEMMDEKKMKSSEWRERLYWIVSLVLIIGS